MKGNSPWFRRRIEHNIGHKVQQTEMQFITIQAKWELEQIHQQQTCKYIAILHPTNFYLTNGFDSNTNSHWRMQADYDGTFHLGMFSSSFYKRLTISPEGNAGIETDTPSSALDIKSTQTTVNFELNIRVDNTEFEKYSRVLVGTDRAVVLDCKHLVINMQVQKCHYSIHQIQLHFMLYLIK